MNNKKTTIQLHVHLDEKNIPETIRWESDDQPVPIMQEAKAMMLALWDKQSRNGMSIDLWTKVMTIEEMNIFIYQSLLTMSDTFERATQNHKEASSLRDFASSFLKSVQQQNNS